jgi:hypothetical protein
METSRFSIIGCLKVRSCLLHTLIATKLKIIFEDKRANLICAIVRDKEKCYETFFV